jgi:hypothetical protein
MNLDVRSQSAIVKVIGEHAVDQHLRPETRRPAGVLCRRMP